MKMIFLLGGKGKRFLDRVNENPEYIRPKPLINVLGRPMVVWAKESFSKISVEDIIFSLMQEHITRFKLDEELKNLFGKEIKIAVDKELKGALPGVVCTKDFMKDEDSFISIDCDALFEGDKFLQKIMEENPDCAVPVFEANKPIFSFAKLDKNMNIIKTAEKEVISNWAIHGAYYFKSWKKFKKFAEEKIMGGNLDGKKEYYIAPMINRFIEEGLKVIAIPCKVESMGTPEQLSDFIKKRLP